MLNTKVTVSSILAAIIVFANQIIPVLPPVWANLIGAVLGVLALYYHGQVVKAARSAGAKGV